MILGAGGTFSGEWDSTGNKNVLLRRGRKFPAPYQPHTTHGNISITYTATEYSPNNSGISYFCVYGWTRDNNLATSDYNRLIEYYIVDNWNGFYEQIGREPNPSNRPPGFWEENLTLKGTLDIDGGTYDIYTSTRTNKPSIDGNRNFTQYWSVRRTSRLSGTISVSEHFKKWEELGMPLGGLYEAALTVEGFNNIGAVTITQNVLTITPP